MRFKEIAMGREKRGNLLIGESCSDRHEEEEEEEEEKEQEQRGRS